MRSYSDVGSLGVAHVLLGGLSDIVQVSYRPLRDAVARLDSRSDGSVLYLDPDSSTEDQCWAMLDALRVLILGVGAAESATPAARLRLVERCRPPVAAECPARDVGGQLDATARRCGAFTAESSSVASNRRSRTRARSSNAQQ